MTGRRVVVTGATGFVGRAICARLQASGHDVVGSARSEAPGPWSSFVPLDVSAVPPEDWPVEKGTVVVHAAGIAHDTGGHAFTEADYHAVNGRGAEAAAMAVRLRGGAGMILLSTVKVISDSTGPTPLDETAPCRPTSAYGRAKLDGERLADSALEGQAPLAILRLTPVYGPGSKGNLGRLVTMAERRWMPLLPKSCGHRSMVHVEDVAALVSELVAQPRDLLMIVSDQEAYSSREIQDAVIGGRAAARRLTVPRVAVRAAARVLGIVPGSSVGPRDAARLLDDARYQSASQIVQWRPQRTLWEHLGSSQRGRASLPFRDRRHH